MNLPHWTDERGGFGRAGDERFDAIDEASAASFPASDPPAFTPIVRTGTPARREVGQGIVRVRLKRVSEPASPEDGRRILVERLWPRGMRKAELQMDAWAKDVAPTSELRRWFGHDPAKWEEFRRRYQAELDAEPEAWAPLLDAARRGTVTLLFSSHDAEHNNVVALKGYLEAQPRR